MNSGTAHRLLLALALTAGGAAVGAQTFTPMPQNPPRDFGASISPAFEGWYDNADGTHSFLIGYYSRNTQAEVDVPIGPNNHFEPGEPDRGQPTHFLPSRRYGMFVVTVPKEFGKTQKLTWTLTANGQTFSIPFYMHPDYNVSPFKSSEQGAHGYNTPPRLRFDLKGPAFEGPAANHLNAIARTATVTQPMTLDLWADDDARYSTNTSVPLDPARPRAPVTALISKYRGPGEVIIGDAHAKLEALKGGKPDEPYSGKASTTVIFARPGDYMLHVTANDYSGNGGGGSVCCWTTAIVKVTVRGLSPNPTQDGQRGE
jgi:hypothetical protein